MSNRALYSTDVGKHKTGVTKTTDSSGTGTPAVQIIVDMGAVALDKASAVRLIEYCTQRIIEDLYPEA